MVYPLFLIKNENNCKINVKLFDNIKISLARKKSDSAKIGKCPGNDVHYHIIFQDDSLDNLTF